MPFAHSQLLADIPAIVFSRKTPKRARFNEAWRRFPFADTLSSISFLTDVEKQTVTMYVTDYTNTVAVTYPQHKRLSDGLGQCPRSAATCRVVDGTAGEFRVEPRSLIQR